MKLKKLIAIGLAAVTMAAFVAGCGTDKQSASKQELPKKIVVGLDDNFPPMGFRDDKGELVGFDIDMAKEAAKRAGMEIEFKPIDWDSKESELKSKHIDVLWNGLTITEDRKKNILFSDSYLKDTQIIITRADSAIAKKADLAGKIVGTQTASTADMLLDKDEFTKQMKEVKKYGDFINAFMDLELGRIDAVIVDGITGNYIMSKNPGKFKIANDKDYASADGADTGVGFRLEDTALRDKFNAILKDMKKDGTADKFAQKWFNNTKMIDKSDLN